MTAIPRSIPGLLANSWVRALAGALLWIAAVAISRPNPFDTAWAKALLLLAPLVLLPIGFDLAAAGSTSGWSNCLKQIVTIVQLPAAVLLGLSYFLPQGPLAASLAVPWFVTTALIAGYGLLQLWKRGLRPLHSVCLDAGLVFVVVGGAWAVADRLGFRPLDFEGVIVLLTAIHFHYAGFALPIVTGLAARQLHGWTATCAGVGVIAAVPMVAVGITATQLQLGSLTECLAAWLMALSGMLAAWLHLQLASRSDWPAVVRGLWAVSGLCLAGSMLLAAMYGTRFYAPVSWLDIPWMRALHGTANALGFGLAGLVAWRLADSLPKAERVRPR